MSAPARAGLFGKLPSRGDFVRLGLPRSFTDPWDDWWQAGLLAAEARAGDGWAAAWQGMAAWRFFLPAGACGPEAVLGVVMPSEDRVGRHYPLTLAAVSPGGWDDVFLDAAQAAGRTALKADLAPDLVLARLGACGSGGTLPRSGIFTTSDATEQPACEVGCSGLPTPAFLAGMIGGGPLPAADQTAWRTAG